MRTLSSLLPITETSTPSAMVQAAVQQNEQLEYRQVTWQFPTWCSPAIRAVSTVATALTRVYTQQKQVFTTCRLTCNASCQWIAPISDGPSCRKVHSIANLNHDFFEIRVCTSLQYKGFWNDTVAYHQHGANHTTSFDGMYSKLVSLSENARCEATGECLIADIMLSVKETCRYTRMRISFS